MKKYIILILIGAGFGFLAYHGTYWMVTNLSPERACGGIAALIGTLIAAKIDSLYSKSHPTK